MRYCGRNSLMLNRRLAALVAVLGMSALAWRCGGSPPAGPTPGGGGGGGGGVPPVPTSVTILAAGDIGECGFGAADTAQLLDRLPGRILALGDLAYMHGSTANFRDCYDPVWGRHLDRTRP